MCQDLRDVDERPEERHLARVHEVSVTNRALKARLRRYVPPYQRVDRVDPEVAAVLEEMEQVPDSRTRVGESTPPRRGMGSFTGSGCPSRWYC